MSSVIKRVPERRDKVRVWVRVRVFAKYLGMGGVGWKEKGFLGSRDSPEH